MSFVRIGKIYLRECSHWRLSSPLVLTLVYRLTCTFVQPLLVRAPLVTSV